MHFHTIPPLLDTMPDKIDLSTATTWRGLRPGMTRAEATHVLEAAKAEISDEDANDAGWLLVHAEEWGMELRFEEGGEQRLRQIVLDDWECTWGGREFCNRPLHEALITLGDAARDAGWRAEDAVNQPFDDLEPSFGSFADEDLLGEGTVWLRQRGLGLVMCDGTVNEVVWRRPEDVPTQLVGPVTEAQRETTKRSDLADHLSNVRVDRRLATSKAASASNPAQKLLTLLLIVALGYVGWLGFQETQRWQTAQMLTGKLDSIDKATRAPWIDRYNIQYTDPAGRPQTASVERGGFYVPPNEKGEETQIAYLAGDPPRVKGPAHARDSAFLEYVPWFIGVAAIYMVLWSIAGFVGRLRRKAAAAQPSGPAPPPSITPGPPQPFTPDHGR